MGYESIFRINNSETAILQVAYRCRTETWVLIIKSKLSASLSVKTIFDMQKL